MNMTTELHLTLGYLTGVRQLLDERIPEKSMDKGVGEYPPK
jgi:hypothetical protein